MGTSVEGLLPGEFSRTRARWPGETPGRGVGGNYAATFKNARFGSGSAVHQHDRLATHLQLAADAAETMRRAPDPPVHLALGLNRQLCEDEVRLGDELAVVGGRHFDVRDEPTHEGRRLLTVALASLE